MVVVNFVNQNNIADNRVYELLDSKFNLFDGVFGCSDEVLGAIDSGVGFEKRLNQIYQTCRTAQEIEVAFDELQKESILFWLTKLTTTTSCFWPYRWHRPILCSIL